MNKTPTVRPIFLVALGLAILAAIWRRKDVMTTLDIVKKNVFRANYGNKRKKPIDKIVIHTTEGVASGAIAWFNMDHKPHGKGPSSAHYLIGKDGKLYGLVSEDMVAYHAGDWNTNERSIGIELERFGPNSPSDYTPAMMNTLVNLVKDVTKRYSIPVNRSNIIGHNEVVDAATGNKGGSTKHVDPVGFPWSDFMNRLSPMGVV